MFLLHQRRGFLRVCFMSWKTSSSNGSSGISCNSMILSTHASFAPALSGPFASSMYSTIFSNMVCELSLSLVRMYKGVASSFMHFRNVIRIDFFYLVKTQNVLRRLFHDSFEQRQATILDRLANIIFAYSVIRTRLRLKVVRYLCRHSSRWCSLLRMTTRSVFVALSHRNCVRHVNRKRL